MYRPNFRSASCSGIPTEMFFPDEAGDYPVDVRQLKKVCANCPMRDACLEWALKHEKEGLWAGTTPRERQRLRKRFGIELQSIRYWEFISVA